MWTSCESYIKSALFFLICCLGPTLCIATFGLAMPTTTPYLFICLFIYLFYLSFLHILISKFNFQNSNFHIYSFNLYYFCYYYYFIYLFIYLFVFKIPSLNNSSKFRFPNLIPSFQNSNFHIYLFNHYIFVIIIILFIYLFIYLFSKLLL